MGIKMVVIVFIFAILPVYSVDQLPQISNLHTINIIIAVVGILLIVSQAIVWKKQKKIQIQFISSLFTDKGEQAVTTVQLPRKQTQIVEYQGCSDTVSPGIKKIMQEQENTQSKRKRRRKADRVSDRRNRDQPSFEEQQS